MRKKLLFAALSAVFMLAMSMFALNIGFRAAAEDGVLDGNTAGYEFVNDASHPWIYERATNTWYNNADSSYNLKKEFTVRITSAGSVAFEYRANLYTSNKQGGKQYAFNNNDFYLTLSKGGVENTIVAKHGIVMSEFERVEIDGLNVGDSITFTHKLGMSSTSDTDRVYIRGLNKPAGDNVTINVTAGENGKLMYEGGEHASVSETIVSGSPLTVTAAADEGYVFAYWTDADGNIASREPVLSLMPLSSADYTAHFYPISDDESASHDENWTEEGGQYKLASQAAGKKTSLNIEFTGERYVFFKYAVNFREQDYDSNTLYVYDSGEELTDFNYYDNTDANAPEFTDQYFHITGEGYHCLEFAYDGTTVTSGGDVVMIKDIQLLKQPLETVEIELSYNDELGTVYLDGAPFAPGKHTVIKGYKIEFSASVREFDSSIDPSQKTTSRWQGFYAKEGHELWPDPHNCNILFDDTSATGNKNKSSYLYVEARFEEIALPAAVSVAVQTGGVMGDEVSLKNGDTVTLPYGLQSNVSVLMRDYDAVQSTYSVKIDDVLRDDIQISEEAGRSYFMLADVTVNHKVTVSYTADGYFASPELTFYIVIEETGSLQENLLIEGVTDITVENDPFMPWQFTPMLTENGQYAYMASNSGELEYYGKSVASIKFTVYGAGVLDFDFKISGASYWLMYNEGAPISTALTVSSLYQQGGIDDNKETVWDPYDKIIARGSASAKAVSGGNKFYWFVGTEYDGGKTTTALSDGWAHVSIPVGAEGEYKDIYVCYYRNADSYSYSKPFSPDSADYCAIRSVGFYKGRSIVKYGVSNAEGGTVTATMSSGGITSGNEIAKGSRVTFSVEVNDGYQFYGWRDANGRFVSAKESFTTSITADEYEVTAVVERENSQMIKIGGTFYADLKSALAAAQSGDKLILLKSLEITENTEIPSGVTLVMPINDKDEYTAIGTEVTAINRVAWTQEAKYLLSTITIGAGVKLTVKGSLYVGAVLHYPDQSAQAHTSGNYNQIVNDGEIEVAEGGKLDVMGLVTGEGSITVKNGGSLYQPFMIADYSGGTNTQGLFGLNQTPFNRYAMVNIQNKGGYTIEYGGTLYGHASLYFWSSVTTIDQPFISYEGGTVSLINLKDGASAHIVYDNGHARPAGGGNTEDIGHTVITVSGNATAGYMSFPLDINTASVAFSIPYNYEIMLEKGDFSLDYAYKLMPGSKLTVGQDATLTLNANLFVYDGLIQTTMSGKGYPNAAQLTAAGYTTCGNLIVDGTLKIAKGVTFLGAVQSNGTGTVDAASGAVLSGRITDGGTTAYDCTLSYFESSARVWDDVHKRLAELLPGHVYKATSDAAWVLPSVSVTYESKNFGNTASMNNHVPHGREGNTLATAQTAEVKGMIGGWRIEHTDHSYDWSPKDGDGSVGENSRWTQLTRRCEELGCTEEAHKYLLYLPQNLGSIEYKGAVIEESDIEALFEEYFGSLGIVISAEVAENARNTGNHSVTITLTDAYWMNDGSYSESAQTMFTVTPSTLTVTVDNKHSAVGEGIAELSVTISGEKGDDLGRISLDKDKLEFSHSINTEQAGAYPVTVSYTGEVANYVLQFVGGTYTVLPTELAGITVADPTVTYGDTLGFTEQDFEALFTVDGNLPDGAEVTIDCSALTASEVLPAGSYEITVSIGYKFEGVDNVVTIPATLTVNKKTVYVYIEDQSADYGGNTVADNAKWHFVEGSALVEGDENDDLGITLHKASGANAGKYDISGSYDSDNYIVVFINEKGTFTINAIDISEHIRIAVEGAKERDGVWRVEYTGSDIPVSAEADGYSVEFVLSHTGLREIGAFEITAEVDDVNYFGSATVNVEVYHAKGYSQDIVDILDELSEKCGDINAANVTADDYDALSTIAKAIDELSGKSVSEDVRKALDEELEVYREALAAWNEKAERDYSSVISEANKMADWPISGLFAAMSLAALGAYILFGGKRK